jgi:DNA-binding MurR/RpiR family transcriptional regulator
MADESAPIVALRQVLEQSRESATPAERAISTYMMENLSSLPFETAASAARKIGVSETTLGRYCRALGLKHFKDLKARLQADIGTHAWLPSDRLREFKERSRRGTVEASLALEKEMSAILTVHELAASAGFSWAVNLLATRREVYVAGFQAERGFAHYFVDSLVYLRPGVRLASSADGHFADVLTANPNEACLVLLDGRRYSRLTLELAKSAKARGMPIILVTDTYCDWGREVATEVFAVPSDLNHFWDATTPMVSLLGLMLNAIFTVLGPEVETRMAEVSDYYGKFVGHTGPSRNQKKKSKNTTSTGEKEQ